MSNAKTERRETPRQTGQSGNFRFGGGARGPAEKPKDFKKTWGRLLKYCGSYLPVMIISIAAAAIGTTLHVLGPNRLGVLTDEIQKGLPQMLDGVPFVGAVNLDVVLWLAAVLLVMYLTAAVLNFTHQFIMATITAKISKSLRDGISKKINKLPFSYFDKAQVGDVISRATNDVDTVGIALSQSVGNMVSSFIMVFGSMLIMFLMNWVLALIVVLTSLFGFMVMVVIMKKSQRHFVEQQKGLGEINGHIEEIYSGHIVVKAYNGGNEAKRIFDRINRGLFVTSWKSQFLSGLMMPIMQFSANLAYVAVCVGGAVMAANDMVTFGVIVAFFFYLRLFINPLTQLAQSIPNIQRAAAAGERVFEFFDEREMSDESGKVATLGNEKGTVKGDVEFKDVNFGYEEGKTVIHNFSAKIKAGQKIAIVGSTGAGKTTIVNLLMRFYELNSGEILMDGTPINNVTRKNVHDQFCMVLQDTWLFEGTIKENVIYSKQGVTDEQVVGACRAAGLHHFIQTLPNGYDTVLNDNANLSAGQKQLLTIARAIIQNTPLLILDEATSSVDTRTEILIQKAMDKLTEGRTSFVIAHRLSTIKNADIILVMRDGGIVESGNHDELLEKGGFYAELYNSQFKGGSGDNS